MGDQGFPRSPLPTFLVAGGVFVKMGIPNAKPGPINYPKNEQYWWQKIKGVGEYPPGYNVKVHGPYYPFKNYAPADTKLTEVKLADLPAWLGRRDTSISGIRRGLTRGYWTWTTRWLHVQSGSTAAYAQAVFGLALFAYWTQYEWLKYQRTVLYHKPSILEIRLSVMVD